ncbi:MAG: sigma-70 family RNA polymerase sigma factor [Chloroflexi bacterium]|nr:sigma-70 family RNA polymerase sigma factor [Chloroflexota bacterium]MCH8236345.1 sigma-70 family RNA polymerase sigma factor [Chloroflexota bacterium]MCH8818343.1 sigma-70 family RNA polymerase sigma factor [Chloroflexota bacterium]
MATIAPPLQAGGTATQVPKRISREEADGLAARLRGRDPGAVEDLYAMIGRRAFGLAYRVLGDGSAAEDAVQEAFLDLWRLAPAVDRSRGRVDSLLMTLVHRRSIDALRARERRTPITGVMPDEVLDHNAVELFERVADALTHERVVECMESLPADQKITIELAYFGGLTHTEIAEQTGAPLGTVKSRLRLGLLRLRADFGIEETS